MNSLDIKNFRKKHNLTQGQLAEITGVSTRAVQSWEQGQRNITQSAIKLIKAFEREKGRHESTGEGEMLKENQEKESQDKDELASYLKTQIDELKAQLKEKDKEIRELNREIGKLQERLEQDSLEPIKGGYDPNVKGKAKLADKKLPAIDK